MEVKIYSKQTHVIHQESVQSDVSDVWTCLTPASSAPTASDKEVTQPIL